MLASGVIFARAVLPQGIDVGINVTKVLPDVLIFDGEVPTESDEGAAPHYEFAASLPPPQPLPDPLPERAFAHIRPDEWIAASSTSVERDEEDGTSVEVLAHIVDVPLEVLPGRDREFRSFVGKVSVQVPLGIQALRQRLIYVMSGLCCYLNRLSLDLRERWLVYRVLPRLPSPLMDYRLTMMARLERWN